MPKCKQCGGYGPEADFGVCVSCEIENDTDKEAIARLIEEGHLNKEMKTALEVAMVEHALKRFPDLIKFIPKTEGSK